MPQGSPPRDASPPSRGQWLAHRVDSIFQDLLPYLALPSPSKAGNKSKQVCNASVDPGGSPVESGAGTSAGCQDWNWDFNGPHVDAAMEEAAGVEDEMAAMSGSVFEWCQVDLEKVSGLRQSITERLNGAWSMEALQRGVAQARAGDYEGAGQSYNQALTLDPTNADALVARGAARANQGQLRLALEDMEAALVLKPKDQNAIKYRAHIKARVEAASAVASTSTRETTGRGKVLEYRSGALVSSTTPSRHGHQTQGTEASTKSPHASTNPEGATVADAKIQDAINIIEKAAKRKHARKKDRKHKRKSKDRRIKTKSDRKASKRDRNDKRKRHSDSPVTSVTTS